MDYKSITIQAALAAVDKDQTWSLSYNAYNAARVGHDEGCYDSEYAECVLAILGEHPALETALGAPRTDSAMSLIGWWGDIASAAQLSINNR